MSEVSIIMGVYNCESTLVEAIESIINQTFQDWELVMCDDGSTDATYRIAEQYKAKMGKKLILLKNERNYGLNYTLNRCLKYASGNYIARMDGDDISLSTRLEKEICFLKENPKYAIVSTPMIYFDENGDWGQGSAIEKPEKKDFIKYSPVFCHAPCMIRKSAYLDVGGYTEDERMLRFEDVNLWYKLYAKGYVGYNLQEPLYKMRDNLEAARRRSLKSRMNGVYTTYVGLQLFESPWYMYIYVVVDFLQHFAKGIIPEKIYLLLHRKRINGGR